ERRLMLRRAVVLKDAHFLKARVDAAIVATTSQLGKCGLIKWIEREDGVFAPHLSIEIEVKVKLAHQPAGFLVTTHARLFIHANQSGVVVVRNNRQTPVAIGGIGLLRTIVLPRRIVSGNKSGICQKISDQFRFAKIWEIVDPT